MKQKYKIHLSVLMVATVLAMFFTSQVAKALPTLNVLSTTPAQNAINAIPSTDITIVFDQSLSAATVNSTTIPVHGSGVLMSGTYTLSTTNPAVTDDTVTFNSSNDFEIGETIEYSITTAVMSTGGDNLALGEVHQFTIEVTSGGGSLRTKSMFLPDTSSSEGYGKALGDFNDDGNLDLVLSRRGPDAFEGVRVLSGNGAGGFSSVFSFGYPFNSRPQKIVPADFNNDGDLDFVIIQGNIGVGTVNIFFGDGAFGFTQSIVSATNTPGPLVVGDIDGDGDVDLVWNDFSSSGVIAINDGSGSFSTSSISLPYGFARSSAQGDFDNDGRLDFVVADQTSNSYQVFLGTGIGTFTSIAAATAVLTFRTEAQSGDLNSDGNLDLIIHGSAGGNHMIEVLLGNGTGSFVSDGTYDLGSTNTQGTSTQVADWDADGDQDVLVAANESAGLMKLLKNDGTGGLDTIENIAIKIGLDSNDYENFGLGDINNDGTLDLTFTRTTGIGADELMVFLNEAVVLFPPFSLKFGSLGSSDGEFSGPEDIVTDVAGNIYVSDESNNRIQKFDSSGAFILAWGSPGTGDGELSGPRGMAIDLAGNIYVTDSGNHRIQKFTSSGVFLLKWGRNGGDGTSGALDGQFSSPTDVALDPSGNVYVGDYGNTRVQKFTSTGTFISKFSTGNNVDIAVDSNGDIYVLNIFSNGVFKYNNSGTFLFSWGSSGTGNGQFNFPQGIDVDVADTVYVVERSNHRVQKFDSRGNFLSKMGKNGGDGTSGSGDGEFNQPRGITIDAAGFVYVADKSNNRVQVFAPVVCGNGFVQSGEQCDDNNVANGDGCSSICQIEGGGGGGRRPIPEEPPPETSPPEEPVVEPPHPSAEETPTPGTPVLPLTALGLIQALNQLFGWMNPVGYQLTNISEVDYRRFHFILRMKQTLKTLAVAVGYSDGYGLNKPDREPMENVAELIKVIMISFSDCYTPSQLERALSHDVPGNGWWWAGYWHFLDPLMQRFLGEGYLLWAPINQLRMLDVLEVFLNDYCGKSEDL